MRESLSDRIFKYVVTALVTLLTLACVLPFVNIVAVSLSSRGAVMSGRVYFFPVELDFTAYKTVFTDSNMIRSLWFTIFLTVVYVAVTMVMTVLAAYPLSRKDLKGRSPLLVFVMFTMYFSGGMIPTYLTISNLNLLNTFWALILPGAISTYNMILMRTYFDSLPLSLQESAYIDGANDWVILVKVVLPLSKAVLATIALFYAVARWNGLTDALLYISRDSMYPLQLRLRQLITNNQVDSMINDVPEAKALLIPETLKSACLVFSLVPILMVYPWLQKHFVKGVMIGSLKG
ncbi:MAG: carbohydrate ABC transporter permease [Christensenellales bacterium]|jgi:putative aldouronate transport system permease protein